MKTLTQYITESQHELYHFTNVKDALKICSVDKWIGSYDDGGNPKGFGYFISTTRQRNALTGYPTGMLGNDLVRFVFDTTAMSKFKIIPYNHFRGFKLRAIKQNWEDQEAFDKYKDEVMLQTNVEAEDRILLRKEEIPNVHKYIKEIDLDDSKTTDAEYELFKEYCDKYSITLIMMDHKKFILGR